MAQKKLFKLTLDKWDSYFFKTKIVKITLLHTQRVCALFSEKLSAAIRQAKGKGIKFALIRLPVRFFSYEKILLRSGFRRVDEGVSLLFKYCSDFNLDEETKVTKPFKPGDLPRVCAIAKKAFTLSYLYRSGFAPRREIDRYHAVWVENLSKDASCKIFVAEHQGYVCGFVALRHDKKERKANIVLIAVRQDMRGQGIGKQLLKTCMRWGHRKLDAISVRTQRENVSAVCFYKSLGFTVVDRDRTLYRKL